MTRLREILARAGDRYRRDRNLLEHILVLAVVLLIVITVLAILASSAAATALAGIIAGFAAGFGIAVAGGLVIAVTAWRDRSRKR